MHFMRALVTASAFAVALLPAAAHAEVRERTMRFATQNVATSPQGQGMARFAELVKTKSGGKLDIRTFPGGQLGGDLQNVSAVQGGTLDFVLLNSGLLVGIDKRFAALDLPFLFATPEEADKVVDGPIGERLHKNLEDKGLVGLAFWELGFRNVTNSKRPINKLEDFNGLKLRVLQSALFIELFNGLGANTVAMPFPEVHTALEQRVVDGQENPYPTILGGKLNEVQKFVSETKHIYNVQSLLVSKRLWDQLSSEERKILQEAAREARDFQRKFPQLVIWPAKLIGG
jgi:TRAP-type transport system periplasmic protein